MRITKTTNSGQKRSVGRQANRKNVCERCCQVRTRRAAWQLTPPIAFLAVTAKCPSPLKKPFPPLAAAGALCQPAAASAPGLIVSLKRDKPHRVRVSSASSWSRAVHHTVGEPRLT